MRSTVICRAHHARERIANWTVRDWGRGVQPKKKPYLHFLYTKWAIIGSEVSKCFFQGTSLYNKKRGWGDGRKDQTPHRKISHPTPQNQRSLWILSPPITPINQLITSIQCACVCVCDPKISLFIPTPLFHFSSIIALTLLSQDNIIG